MREILFRGKRICRKDTGKWVEGDLMTNCTRSDCEIRNYDKNSVYYGKSYSVEEETVGQFIGLFDKNGNRIFEGDILRHSYWHGNEKKSRNICVRFLNGAFCWSTSADNDENCFAFADSEMYGINTEKDCEVIGNIFDNRELLEE